MISLSKYFPIPRELDAICTTLSEDFIQDQWLLYYDSNTCTA